jgi:hypothetical protein
MAAWLANNVRGIIDEACSVVADVDTMGHWGGRGVPRGGGSG